MSWHVEATGSKQKASNFCTQQKYFIENAPIGVQTALKELLSYFSEETVIHIICSGHIAVDGGNIKIEISNIPYWIR